MASVLLARHGNTFGPGDKIVWVGAKEDLPLVEKGEAQARALGEALAQAGLRPARMVSGPLKRTRRAAEIVAELTGFDAEVRIDDRLKEIDYGAWGGKSDPEIIAQWGEDALAVWRDEHRRPPGADWTPSEDALAANARAVLAKASQGEGLSLVITSNGILRYMYAALSGPAEDAKVKTGHVCGAKANERLFWNLKPEDAPLADLR
jgi:probable phosphoglycerate mutase